MKSNGNWTHLAVRILAMFLGTFTLLNLLGEMLFRGFGMNLWWIDLSPLPAWAAAGILAAAAAVLIAVALKPRAGQLRRWITISLVAVLIVAAAWNTVNFYVLLARGAVRTPLPVPLSLLVVASLTGVLRMVFRAQPLRTRRPQWLVAVIGVGACAVAFPLLQMTFFGSTDYRRCADVIVVFGAGVYADGTCSLAAADRVRTAADLYRRGYASRVVISGGPGMGAVHETTAMRRLAMDLGVPAEAIRVDTEGLSTAHTVANTRRMFDEEGTRRVLVVSQFYHLPRIKMAYQRAGWDVYTVPARQTRVLRRLPYYMAREAAAVWTYYFRPLT